MQSMLVYYYKLQASSSFMLVCMASLATQWFTGFEA
jgi:hypothetical protein